MFFSNEVSGIKIEKIKFEKLKGKRWVVKGLNPENRILRRWWSEFSFTAESVEALEWMASHILGSEGESRANKRIS